MSSAANSPSLQSLGPSSQLSQKSDEISAKPAARKILKKRLGSLASAGSQNKGKKKLSELRRLKKRKREERASKDDDGAAAGGGKFLVFGLMFLQSPRELIDYRSADEKLNCRDKRRAFCHYIGFDFLF